MESSPGEIEKQLEALLKWREGYRAILEAKHQQERASFEMYLASDGLASGSVCQIEEIHENACNDEQGKQDKQDSENSVPEVSKQTSGYITDCKLDSEIKNVEIPSNAPRPFLRRGEGIKQRFKMAPDAFNLRTLPPYKFANAHPKLRQPNKGLTKPKEKKRKVKVAVPSDSVDKDLPKVTDTQEIHFQHILFESKTMVNSTPDPKAIGKSKSITSMAFKSTESVEHANDSRPRSTRSLNSLSSNSMPLSIAWAKVLDPSHINPIEVTELRSQSAQQEHSNQLDESDDENLNIFELLEEKAKEGSFNMNSSVIKRVLAERGALKREDEQDSDIIPVTSQIRKSKIGTKVTLNVDLNCSDSDSNDESEENEDYGNDDSDNDNEIDGTEERKGTSDCNETNEDSGVKGKESGKTTARLHVRFVEDTNQTVDEPSTTLQSEDTLNGMNTELFFEHAKEILLNAMSKNQKNASETILSDSSQLNPDDIRKLAEQSKERLAELEHQIALMKENNAELLKAKREHEMEKVAFMQQQEEALEQINDERVKMEIQLHDERMRLEEDRRKVEEKLRMQKTAIISAERKEIMKLKEQVAILEAKLRDKDQAHVAAQGRIRAQMRCLEKEQKDLYAEIERLNRENKKLEKLNAQLSREQNMSMLNEINRNIVKLAESKNSTTCNAQTQSEAIKTGSKSSSTLSSLRRRNIQKEAMKTIKITESSFGHLLSSNKSNKILDSTKDDTENFEAIEATETVQEDTIVDDSKLTTAPSITMDTEEQHQMNEATNDTSKSGLRVLTRESTTEDGGKEFIYPNGTVKRESADGMTVRMMYFNGDVKETNVQEGTIKYYYSNTNTWHTTYLDGLEILEFPNGQVEHRHPNGIVEIHYPNNSVKVVDPNDKEKLSEWRFHDGSVVHEKRNGDRLLILSNGQRELHTKQFKRREYPDGTVKTVFPDGSYETRYSNGRIRLKDKEGNLIVDSEMQP